MTRRPPACHAATGRPPATSARPRPTVTVLIPAHNEQDQILAAIASVQRQTRPVDEIIVITDNCTDQTAQVARASGVTVVATAGNTRRKAGALNQALAALLPDAGDHDQVLVMDADSCLDPRFAEVATEWLGRDDGPRYGGIGGTFRGRRDPHGAMSLPRRLATWWVETVQCNEYARYGRDVNRKRGKVLVLTGTAAIFSVAALKDVVAARRSGRLPCTDRGSAGVYDTSVLTEDNELTLALMHLGWRVRSPRGCTLTTEVMPTWRDLYRQRLRWKRGAMENLVQYRLTRVTAKYWGYQILTFAGVVVTCAYLAGIALALAVDHSLSLHGLWLAVTVIFMAERVVTVRARGGRQMLLAAALLPEMVFDIFLQATHAKALLDSLLGKSRHW
jgi:cellulose synthase/poly-beta-1,6-N-acetylglucosamine synthase-like glycosyltransferase